MTDLTAEEESHEMIRVAVIVDMIIETDTAAHAIGTTDITTGMTAVTDTVVLVTDAIIHIQIEKMADEAIEALGLEERKVEVTQRGVIHVLEERAAQKR